MNRQQKLNLIYKNMHRDFKGKIDGQKSVMVYRNGTCIVMLNDLTNEEIEKMLPKVK